MQIHSLCMHPGKEKKKQEQRLLQGLLTHLCSCIILTLKKEKDEGAGLCFGAETFKDVKQSGIRSREESALRNTGFVRYVHDPNQSLFIL